MARYYEIEMPVGVSFRTADVAFRVTRQVAAAFAGRLRRMLRPGPVPR